MTDLGLHPAARPNPTCCCWARRSPISFWSSSWSRFMSSHDCCSRLRSRSSCPFSRLSMSTSSFSWVWSLRSRLWSVLKYPPHTVSPRQPPTPTPRHHQPLQDPKLPIHQPGTIEAGSTALRSRPKPAISQMPEGSKPLIKSLTPKRACIQNQKKGSWGGKPLPGVNLAPPRTKVLRPGQTSAGWQANTLRGAPGNQKGTGSICLSYGWSCSKAP